MNQIWVEKICEQKVRLEKIFVCERKALVGKEVSAEQVSAKRGSAERIWTKM